MTQPKFKVKRGDFVQIMVGKDKGKRGTVTKVDLTEGRVMIEGLGTYMRHIRPSMTHPEGRVQKQHSYHISNVAIVDPSTNSISKVGYRMNEQGGKERFFKESGSVVPMSKDFVKRK